MRDNYFDLIRLVLAFLVAFEHSFVVFEGNPASPFGFLHMSLNHFAVNGFFIISGFLVTQSMVYREDVVSFVRSRLLRIYPALLFLVLALALVAGPVLTSLPPATYFSDPQLLDYALQALTFREADPALPGVSLNVGAPQSLSIVLWTLRYEMIAYAATVIIFVTGILRRPGLVAAATITVFVAYGLYLEGFKDQMNGTTIEALLRFGACYLLGKLLALSPGWSQSAPILAGVFLVLGIILVRAGYNSGEIALNLSLGFGLLSLAFANLPTPFQRFQRMEDISYGLYIWHWPVFQIVGHTFPEWGTLGILIVGLPIAVAIAAASWLLIEKPALRLKPKRPRIERSL